MEKKYDLFISHASEDKDAIVRSLATLLGRMSVRVWYDEFSLQLGDSIDRQGVAGIKGMACWFFQKHSSPRDGRSMNIVR